jgi:hypothetical protein
MNIIVLVNLNPILNKKILLLFVQIIFEYVKVLQNVNFVSQMRNKRVSFFSNRFDLGQRLAMQCSYCKITNTLLGFIPKTPL